MDDVVNFLPFSGAGAAGELVSEFVDDFICERLHRSDVDGPGGVQDAEACDVSFAASGWRCQQEVVVRLRDFEQL